MRLSIVGHLLARAGLQHEGAAVFEFGVQLAFQAQKSVPLDAFWADDRWDPNPQAAHRSGA